MKKKLNISVADIVHRAHSPKFDTHQLTTNYHNNNTNFTNNIHVHNNNNVNKKPSTPLAISDKHNIQRFQDLYKQALQNYNSNNNINNNNYQHNYQPQKIYQSSKHTNTHSNLNLNSNIKKYTPTNSTQRNNKKQLSCSYSIGYNTNTNNNNKKSMNSSAVSSAVNSCKKTMPSSVPSQRIIQPFKENNNNNVNNIVTNYESCKQFKQKISVNCTPQKQVYKNTKTSNSLNNNYINPNTKNNNNNNSSNKNKNKIYAQLQYNKFVIKFEECLKNINHEMHCHLTQRNQCFLSQNQIDYILLQLGYNLKSDKHNDFLNLLQVDMYGGAPSQNLRQILAIIEIKQQGTKRSYRENKDGNISISIKNLPKVVDKNLKIQVSQENKYLIYQYFQGFKPQVLNYEKQKQNHSNFANKTFININNSLKKSNKQKYDPYFEETQDTYNSPNKKISNPVITQLIQALTQSQNKKSQRKQGIKQQTSVFSAISKPIQSFNKLLQRQRQRSKQKSKEKSKEKERSKQKLNDNNTQNLGTFRKIQRLGAEQQGEQYNFSRQLSGDGKNQQKQYQDIVQLKNRLNQALKKTSTSSFQPSHVPSNFSSNSSYNYNYNSKQNYNSPYYQLNTFQNFLPTSLQKYHRSSNKPILSIDVNLGDGISQKIIVYEGQTAQQVSQRLSMKYTISEQTKLKFQKILQSHLSTMLWKIQQVSQEMLTDRTEGDL